MGLAARGRAGSHRDADKRDSRIKKIFLKSYDEKILHLQGIDTDSVLKGKNIYTFFKHHDI